MKARILVVLLLFAATAAFIGCGSSGSSQSSQLAINMALLQVDGSPLIYGTVFSDADGDGVMGTEEPGIEGVAVTLLDGNAMFLEAATTNASGEYAFAVSVDTSYAVTETDPVGYYSTTANASSVDVHDTSVRVDFGDRTIQEAPVDVKPGSDINPLNLRSKGVLPVAILGSGDLDVTTIDPSSLLLNGVAPLRWSYEDVCGPDDLHMECSDGETPDGFTDLTLKFSTQEIAQTFSGVQRGDIASLVMTGSLLDGTPISGNETVWIVQVPK